MITNDALNSSVCFICLCQSHVIDFNGSVLSRDILNDFPLCKTSLPYVFGSLRGFPESPASALAGWSLFYMQCLFENDVSFITSALHPNGLHCIAMLTVFISPF